MSRRIRNRSLKSIRSALYEVWTPSVLSEVFPEVPVAVAFDDSSVINLYVPSKNATLTCDPALSDTELSFPFICAGRIDKAMNALLSAARELPDAVQPPWVPEVTVSISGQPIQQYEDNTTDNGTTAPANI